MRCPDDPALTPLLPAAGGIRRVAAQRIVAPDRQAEAEDCWVVEEQALFIDVGGVGLYTLMWTRTDAAAAAGFLPAEGVLGESAEPEALALCAGFLLTESIIESSADIAELALCPDAPDVVRVRLVDPTRARTNRRSGLVASSCGICGGVDQAGDLVAALPKVDDTLRLDPARFTDLMTTMRSRQRVFNATGGTHAAALFSPQMEIVAMAEDLGRHNAMDKVIGLCLLRGQPSAGCGVMLSGRVSLEMIVKAARAGIEVVAAVSAPSSLAIDAAARLGITLCGFVRDGRLTAFTHAGRLARR